MRWGLKSTVKNLYNKSCENLNLQMKVAQTLKGGSRKVTCIEASEAHMQFTKLRAEEPQENREFTEIFERALEPKITQH